MSQGFMPAIGNHYDRIRIEKDKTSHSANYFNAAINRASKISGTHFVLETSSSILIWCEAENTTIDAIRHIVVNGISFSYEFAQFTVNHANRIEGYNFSNEENHGNI